MTNLLPQQSLNVLIRERRMRTLISGLIALLCIAVIGSVLLIPPYFLSESKEREAEKRSALLARILAVREKEGTTSQLQELQQMTRLLVAEKQEPIFIPHLASVVAVRPSAVTLQRISWSAGEGGGGQMEVQGRARTRDALINFRDALREVSGVSAVTLPVSHLADRVDLSFVLSITFAHDIPQSTGILSIPKEI